MIRAPEKTEESRGNDLVLFEVLQTRNIGIRLTGGMMMEPEASISAMVLNHPDSRYFSTGSEASR